MKVYWNGLDLIFAGAFAFCILAMAVIYLAGMINDIIQSKKRKRHEGHNK